MLTHMHVPVHSYICIKLCMHANACTCTVQSQILYHVTPWIYPHIYTMYCAVVLRDRRVVVRGSTWGLRSNIVQHTYAHTRARIRPAHPAINSASKWVTCSFYCIVIITSSSRCIRPLTARRRMFARHG